MNFKIKLVISDELLMVTAIIKQNYLKIFLVELCVNFSVSL